MRITTETARNDNGVRQALRGSHEPVAFAPDLDSALERESRGRRRRLEELMEAVEDAAARVDREPTVRNYTAWRDSLAIFLRSAAHQAYRVENLRSGGREYEIVRTINAEADRLFHLIATGARERARVAETLVKLRGLMVSLLA